MTQKSTWNVNPLDFMTDVNLSIQKRTLEVANAIFEGVVDRSPVFTGNFRASWRMSHTIEDLSISDGGSSESPLPAPRTPSLANLPKIPIIFITNAQPYALRLEYGWSKQAPSGIVRSTLLALS